MTLAILLATYLGVSIECLWLWDLAGEKFERTRADRVTLPGPSRIGMIIGFTTAGGALLIGLAAWIGENPVTRAIAGTLALWLMGAAMFFILVAGAVGGRLLPRVNEYNIISVLAIVAIYAITWGSLAPWLLGLVIGIPFLLALALVLQCTPPTPAGKALLYLIYLGSLVLMTFQSGILQGLQKTDFSIPDAFVFGSVFSFLCLHVLFGLRFLLITTSFLVPSNRIYIRPVMDKLYRDDQLPPAPFFLVLAAVLAAVALNHWLGIFPSDTFVGLAILLCAQLFFHPHHVSPEV